MPGINSSVIVHKLWLNPTKKRSGRKKRSFNIERFEALASDVEKLLRAGFIREPTYPYWIANVVMVRQSLGKWRKCTDFTDLNMACSKDNFPISSISLLVDCTMGFRLLGFMDAYSGYNQIMMAEEDQEKTIFITDRGLYCYKVMPFGLKNAGATY